MEFEFENALKSSIFNHFNDKKKLHNKLFYHRIHNCLNRLKLEDVFEVLIKKHIFIDFLLVNA